VGRRGGGDWGPGGGEDRQHRFLCYDLLPGRVMPGHPLFAWRVRNGASPDDLAAFVRAPIALDVLGLNFYPQWSTQQLSADSKGRLIYRAVEKDGAGFAELIASYYERYRRPVMVTETSAFGADDLRSRWLAASVGAIKGLRGQGVPVHGYTWFPLFTMIDWRYRTGRGPLDDYRLDLGLYALDQGGAETRWRATPLVEQFRDYVANP